MEIERWYGYKISNTSTITRQKHHISKKTFGAGTKPLQKEKEELLCYKLKGDAVSEDDVGERKSFLFDPHTPSTKRSTYHPICTKFTALPLGDQWSLYPLVRINSTGCKTIHVTLSPRVSTSASIASNLTRSSPNQPESSLPWHGQHLYLQPCKMRP